MDHEKFWVTKKFGSRKKLGHKKILVPNNLGHKKILVPNNLGPIKVWVLKIFLGWFRLSSSRLGQVSQLGWSCWSSWSGCKPNFFLDPDFLKPKNSGTTIFRDPKSFVGRSNIDTHKPFA